MTAATLRSGRAPREKIPRAVPQSRAPRRACTGSRLATTRMFCRTFIRVSPGTDSVSFPEKVDVAPPIRSVRCPRTSGSFATAVSSHLAPERRSPRRGGLRTGLVPARPEPRRALARSSRPWGRTRVCSRFLPTAHEYLRVSCVPSRRALRPPPAWCGRCREPSSSTVHRACLLATGMSAQRRSWPRRHRVPTCPVLSTGAHFSGMAALGGSVAVGPRLEQESPCDARRARTGA